MKKLLDVNIWSLSWLERLWLCAPVAIWFSFQPFLRFGQDSTSYYELSVVMAYVVVLALVGLPNVWGARKAILRDRAMQLTGAFVGLSVVSLFWTSNITRGVLTVGVIGLLYLILLAAIVEYKRLRKLLPALATLLVLSAVVVSILAFIQVIAGIWLLRAETLLCAGCVADQFGFVRPNVFAIEPQFLGSLLIAPLLVLLHVFLNGKRSGTVVASFLLISSALFMTLSRGAILAFALGALLLFILNWRKARSIVGGVAIVVGAFVITLLVQGTAAALNPRVNVTFYEAISTSINQLSLGVLKLPSEQTAPNKDGTGTAPVFNGYVEESTGTRLSLTGLAIGTWKAGSARILFGVGVGASGVAIHEQYPDRIDAREIIQNEYIEILLEYGLVGLALFAVLLVGFLYGTRREKWAWAFLAAYAVQWMFFSGYPNALHIYLVLFALYAAFRVPSATERRASVAPKQ